jgi:hypothetical protein
MKKETSIGQSRPNLLAIPHQLKALAQWMPYKLEPRPNSNKFNKVPKNRFGYKASKIDRHNWLSFEECLALCEGNQTRFDGIGFCPNNPQLLFIDLDDCIQSDGSLDDRARKLVDGIDGYVERSLSGSGVHIVTLADKQYGNPKSADGKVEIFTNGMYLAMTGDVLEGRLTIPSSPPSTTILDRYLQRAESNKPLDDFEIFSKRVSSLTIGKAREILINELVPDPNRDDWLQLGMALHFQFDGSYDALELWDEYSRREGAGNYQGLSDLEKTWSGFKSNHPNPITFASIYQRLKVQLAEVDVNELIAANPPLRYSITKPKAVRYVLNGFMGEGITSIAGAGGSGKTTMIVEMASIVAHLCNEPDLGIDSHFLKVNGRRRVIHFAEDTRQVEAALYAKSKFGKGPSSITCSEDEANEWYQLVQTKKYKATELAKIIEAYSERYTEHWPTGIYDAEGNERFVLMPPLMIFDTQSATFDLEDENSNSEQSKMIAAIKKVTCIHNDPIWVVTHIAKNARDKDVKQQTSRGAGAIEADAQTVASLAREIGQGYTVLSINKNRIQTQFDELQFHPQFHSEIVEDEWGEPQEVTYITGELVKGTSSQRISSKQDSKKQAADIDRQKKLEENALEAFKLIFSAPAGIIYSKDDVRGSLSVGSAQSQAAIGYLIKGGYLTSRQLTKEERIAAPGKRNGLFITKNMLAERDFDIEVSDE